MIKVVYFNQWFSSITDVIADLKLKHHEDIKVIASSRNPDHAYKDVVDEFIVEDWQEGINKEDTMNNYIKWVLNICIKYKVDYFFVKKYMEEISKYRNEFAQVNTFLVCEVSEKLEQFSSKAGVYNNLYRNPKLRKYIPQYYCGDNFIKIIDIINTASNKDNTPYCFKLDSDEGGASFRRIEQKRLDFSSLYKFRTNSVSVEDAMSIIQDAPEEYLRKLIFMELLDSPEISVDCYKSKNGFIAMCREKESTTRVQKIYYNKIISSICEEIGNTYDLYFPFNVQFRIKHDSDRADFNNLRLLEVNTRMSGGTYYTTLFDKNIADACLCDIMNMSEKYSIDTYRDFKDLRVTHVEKAVRL